MKHLKLFFALFAMLALGVGNAWGETKTYVMYPDGGSTFNSEWSKTSRTAKQTYASKVVVQMMGVNSGVYGEITSKNSVTNINAISVTCTANNAQKLTLYYSTDNSQWTELSNTSISKNTSSYNDYDVDVTGIPTTAYIKFRAEKNSIYLYSITISTSEVATPDPVDPTVSFNDASYTVGQTLDLSSLWTSNSTGEVTYTVANAGTTGASISGSLFTATAAGTCTVKASQAATNAYNTIDKTATITVTAPTPATVSLSEAGAVTNVADKNVGDSYTLPLTSTQTCGDKVFVGWSTMEIATPGDKPTSNFYEPGATVTLSAEQTFYAVYATSSGTPETWEQTTSVAVGDLVVIAQVDDGTKEMTGLGKTPVTDNNNYGTGTDFLTNPNGTLIWTVEEGNTSGQFSFNNGSYYLNLGSNNNYLSYSETKTATSSWTVSTSEERAVVTNANYDSRKIMWNKTNTRFASYSKNHGNNSGQYYYHIVFYKKSGGISYSDYTTSCAAAPEPAVLVSIAVNAEGKNEFTEGDEFVKATITATYDDETTKDVTSLATFTGYDMNTTGTQTVTVTYEGKTTTYQITVNAKTPATLILSKNGVEEALEGEHKVGDVVTLPSITSDCVKQFVGWSTDANCATAPEYAPGADFTLTAEEHTLYAVYGTQTGGGEGVLTKMTSTDAFANGDKVVIVAYGTQLGMYQETSGTSYVKYWELAGNEPTVAELDEKTIWDVEANGENWKIGDATIGYLYNASSNNLAVSTTNASTWTITWKENGFVFKSDLDRYMACRTDLTTSNKNLYRMNGTSVSNNSTYEMDVYKYTSSAPIYSEFSTTCSAAPDAPVFSVGTGTYNAAQTVTITAEDGATIYYTVDGNNPTNESNVYSSALTISETTTLKAIAVKDGISSAITTATYTIKLPLTTIDQIFAKATEVGGIATAVEITMGGWTVSGANAKNVFVTDGTKGFIIYKSDEGHGFNVGDVLSGTVACKVQLFKGSAELTELTSTTSGLTVTTGGTVAPVTLDAAGITALTGVNTGSVIKINGTCTLEDSKYYVAGVQLYNTLYEFQTLEPSAEYNVTGVYQLYTTTKEILPRQEADIEKIESLPTATISIADITMEVEETKTITATIYPAAAADAVVYSTASSCISISGNTITALTEGTATVTATITDSDDKYYGATKDFTVTVTPKSTKDKVVILAKYGDQWYAMMAQYVSGKTSHLAALPVTYVGGKLYNVADADKTLIEWERAVVDGKATFSNNSKYLTGKSDKTDLTLAATSCDWTISGESYLIGERTFFYNAENNWFRNFGTSNAGNKNYSGMPTVTAPVYATGDAYGRSVNLGEDGYRYGTICLPFGSTNFTGAEFFECVGKEEGKVYIASVTTLVAGTPYIFLASATEVAVYGNGTTAATPGSKNGLVGTFTNDTEVAVGRYILLNNELHQAEAICYVNANRAYIVMEDVPAGVPQQMPGRRYIGMSVQGENEATGFDNIQLPNANSQKLIINGQLIIIRDGVMYNAQGVRF